jgi:hypothetical protein
MNPLQHILHTSLYIIKKEYGKDVLSDNLRFIIQVHTIYLYT